MKYITWLILACVPLQCFAASMNVSNMGPSLQAEKNVDQAPQFMPQPIMPPQTVSQEEVQRSSLETLDINASGNWLEKRYWYQKAEKTYELTKSTVAEIVDMRAAFYSAAHGIGQQLDTFYETVNFDKGQIDYLLQDALQDTDLLKDDRGDLSPEEREIKNNIKADQKQLELIGKTIKGIHDLDKSVEDVFAQALQIIDNARKYEIEAWESFKTIAYDLDDKKAEAEYLKIDGYYQNAQQTLGFLKTQLLTYLQQALIQKITVHVSKVQQSLEDLKKKDLDAKKQREKEAIKLAVQVEGEKFAEKMHKAESAKQAPVAQEAWYDFVFVWYDSAVVLISSAFSNIGMLGAQLWNMIQEAAVSAYTWMLSWVKK
jgi:hypothetical protein